MRIRFLKSKSYTGLHAAVIDGNFTVSDRRISVVALNNYEIQDYQVVDGGNVDITLLDGAVYRVPGDDVEITTPSTGPNPTAPCCNK